MTSSGDRPAGPAQGAPPWAPQRLLRAVFMQVEALFNRAFGDRLNPLYHLGATAFWLFWIVAATGLVLYVFFDTSVAGAYRSVQALGAPVGLLRSLHRYASDAMVLVMAVHLMRYWAFDRLRGFRALSWLTGVVLIVLVGVAGAGGYALPWDRLAQFVVQASFQWLDALPGIGGTLVRNVLVPARVGDRLFSLLVFVHIGVPLITLLLMWVHVQRVPKAATQPPRPIAVATLLALLALALLLPVHSQGGPADLMQAPGALALDWWLLGLYPLVDRWSPLAVWMLVGGSTALLVLLPWLPPRRGGAPLQLSLYPGPATVSVRRGETMLEAGLRAGLALPHECRAGACGLCRCTVLAGPFDPGPVQPAALATLNAAAGASAGAAALMCCAMPLGDCVIEVDALPPAAGPHAQGLWHARVAALERLADDVMLVRLALPAGQRVPFRAGQYLNILLPDGSRRAFSFANPPHEGPDIELHVRRVPGGRFTGHVFEQMAIGDALHVEGPLGQFVMDEDGGPAQRPVLFVAGATGFAPVKSLLEDAFHRGVTRPLVLYWGARRRADLYALDLVERWTREHPNFRFVPVLSEPGDGDWRGRRGLVHEVLLQDHPDLSGLQVYACGSLPMVNAAVPEFLAHGLEQQACRSDAFTPAAPPPG
jgi:CDP-4-dehydro-6-deoxyglucose reductase